MVNACLIVLCIFLSKISSVQAYILLDGWSMFGGLAVAIIAMWSTLVSFVFYNIYILRFTGTSVQVFIVFVGCHNILYRYSR